MDNMLFEWTPTLAIGSSFIDNQHKQLFAAASALFEACQIGKEGVEVERTMLFLLDYTAKHFADEETLQKKYNYPDYPAHKQIHDDFQTVAQGMAEKLFQNGPTDDFISEVYITIGEWLIEHVRGEDAKLAAYIRE
jgi:hemerythrin